MEFINDPVGIAVLPKAEEVVFTPIEKEYLTVIRIEWAISSAVLLIIAIILIFSIEPLQQPIWVTMITVTWLVITIGYLVLQAKSFKQKAYALRDKDVIYKSGWIIQRIRTCPFNRIQHSSVSTGVFERKYGLATLILYTAGTDDADIRIPGLKEIQAYTMKEWITQKIVHEKQPGT
jgi:membrane protein YdbS with pleckstrin-like domain